MKIVFTLFLSISVSYAYAQEEELLNKECGTTRYMEDLKKLDPDLEKRMTDYENQIQEFLVKHPNGKMDNTQSVIIIPTVVHVVWRTASENISNNAVNAMINMMNQDYGKTNPDTSQTPAVWKPIAANTGIQFCLAKRDPDGVPANGIVRTQTAATSFTNNNVKFTSKGGSDAWNTTQYFNIWICKIGGGISGVGEFPTSSASNTYGLVVDYTLYNVYTVTHEIGHCFNLFHIWGDDGTACTGSDKVNDTPNQAGPSSLSCSAFPAYDACSPSFPGHMFMNYMNYGNVYTSCKTLFTEGQSARCNAVLNMAPYNALATSLGCLPVNLVQNDAAVTVISTPKGLTCAVNFTPVVTIRNWGSNNLTSCIVNYQIDADPVQTFNWTGTLTSLATVTVTLSPMVTTAGTHTFTCYTSQPNGTSDGNTANDSQSADFNVIPSGQALPLQEGLESVAFPPAGWTLDNPDGSVTWARTTSAAKTGSASMWFNSKNYSCNGCIDILQTPNLDLSSINSPQVTFQVAYRMLSNPSASPNWSDSLRVDISTDCGVTWTNLYFKYSTNLTTIIPTFSTTSFIPGPNDWRLETISLAPYSSSNNVLLRWKVSSDHENNLYVDDINITSILGMNETDIDRYVSVFPNPSADGIVWINLNAFDLGQVNIKIYNVLGEVIGRYVENVSAPKKIRLNLENNPNGIYLVEVKTNNAKATKKFILNK